MTTEPRVEWVGRTDMAEVAEALGVPTDMVMGVHSDGFVLWTERDAPEEPIWGARIGRGADGVIVVGPRTSTGTLGEWEAGLRAAIDRALGDG